MHFLPQTVLDADRTIYHALSQLHGNWFLDRWMIFQETNVLFKSGVFISLYVYFWFRPEPNQEARRRAILAIMLGTIGALVMSRIISNLVAFRVRPLDVATLGFRPRYRVIQHRSWKDKSSLFCIKADFHSQRTTIGIEILRLKPGEQDLYLVPMFCAGKLADDIHSDRCFM